VRRGGDREELGEALDDPLDDGLQRRLWRRPTSAVAAARATIALVPTTTVAVRARVTAV
jgi:hypothetical protein